MKKKSHSEVARSLLDSKNVSPHIRHVGLSGDWSVSAWTMPGDKFLLDDESIDGTWSLVTRYYVDDDYEGVPEEHSGDVDGDNDLILEEKSMTFLQAVDLAFKAQ